MATQAMVVNPGAQMPMVANVTLADVLEMTTSGRYVALAVKRSLNLGTNTMLTSLDIGTFVAQSVVGNDPLRGPVTQRKIDMGHARKMAVFIMKGLVNFVIRQRHGQGVAIPEEIKYVAQHLGDQPYYAWAPVVGSIRDPLEQIEVEVGHGRADGEVTLKLKGNQLIWIVDGQHRRAAWGMVLDFLKQVTVERSYRRAGGLVPGDLKEVADDAQSFWHEAQAYYAEKFSVPVDLHFGLSVEQERQLFHDLNNLAKSVSAGQAQAFDQSNPINVFTHRLVASLLSERVEITETARVEWPDKAWMRLDTLNGINARLFANGTTIRGAKPTQVAEREAVAWDFWQAVMTIPGIESREASVAAQAALLKALARVTYDLAWGEQADANMLKKYLTALPTLPYTHDTAIWNLTALQDAQIKKDYPKLLSYLPSNWRTKSLASKVEGKIRFGARHNESILVLPGIVRYLAKLPPESRT